MKFLRTGECNYTEKVLFVHFISMQLNFPVLSMFNCVAPQNAGFMDHRMHVQLLSFFLETKYFFEKMVRQNTFTVGYFISIFCIYRQNKRKLIILHALGKTADFH